MLEGFGQAAREWFLEVFPAPTRAQMDAWPAIQRGEHTLLLAPTGSGKTLAAFLWAIDRLMAAPVPPKEGRCRVLYVSPLKALAVDVERNLRAPLVGIANRAVSMGVRHHVPTITVRTGDTPAGDRTRFLRDSSDILITTPESLFLLLTSRAAELLSGVETVIVDEIHALVPTKRGSHLTLSLERLEAITHAPPQRIGLSATQRPLHEVARFLVGFSPRSGESAAIERPVTIVDASEPKRLSLRVEVPVEDMAAIGRIDDGEASPRFSIWEAVHPRLWEIVSAHRSTILFCNSRRLAERLAAAINEAAGEAVCRAHHGSLARLQRLEIEDALKGGRLRALVATSSLELGIDMGAVDLVVQIEAPPSVASGMQRIGRASHQVGATSHGIIFPKYRGDLLSCAALTEAMSRGAVEATHYPRSPLDVLAQQIVAIVAMRETSVDALFELVRAAAPFSQLVRDVFEGVLDMLAGRYASETFSGLRPRIVWDRIAGTVAGRKGAQRLAVANAGTIPDRGLYGVFLADSGGDATSSAGRIGELDEEMVFETIRGETFLLGASTWRVVDITLDRVLVTPAPGQPGKMPFWRGERPFRPLEFGRAIGELCRELSESARAAGVAKLVATHALEPVAAENLLSYLDEQRARGVLPSDRRIVIERSRDELGDHRICVLSPFGGRVHAPWAMAVLGMLRDETGVTPQVTWSDDGFVVRVGETIEAPSSELLVPLSNSVEARVVAELEGSGLFAACFREAASRALLLPRRQAGKRTPLWRQRQRATELLGVASRHPNFPIVLEAYRECLADVFDMVALRELLHAIELGSIEVRVVDTERPSPFASALLFNYAANFIYDGDAPPAERRAQALSIDHERLRELLGDIELRELIDPDIMAELEDELQLLAGDRRARDTDELHDVLLRLGDLPAEALRLRSALPADQHETSLAALLSARRVVVLKIAGEVRLVATEQAARFRDGLGVVLPGGLPERLLDAVPEAKREILLTFARTHGPFDAEAIAERYGLSKVAVVRVLQDLVARRELVEGAFRRGRVEIEWCHPEVLSRLRSRALARHRREVEAVPPDSLVRALATWHRVSSPRRGPDGLLDTIEQLQGAPLPASILEREILPARVRDYRPSDLDLLAAAGEIVWQGLESLGTNDGRVALYLADHFAHLRAPPSAEELDDLEARLLSVLQRSGASFFSSLPGAVEAGSDEVLAALWRLVWKGRVGNDTFGSLRAYVGGRKTGRPSTMSFRSRRSLRPAAEGRWLAFSDASAPATTDRLARKAQQLLDRFGLVTREVASAEGFEGGLWGSYELFRALEDAGRVRRGYFVIGVGSLQFATPAMLDLLRACRETQGPSATVLSAVDPASPFGSLLPWPEGSTTARRMVGAKVVVVDGSVRAFVTRRLRRLLTFLDEGAPGDEQARVVAHALAVASLRTGERGTIREIDGRAVLTVAHERMLTALETAGFVRSYDGLRPPETKPSALLDVSFFGLSLTPESGSRSAVGRT